MSKDENQWYYDLGDTATDADDPNEIFGKDMRLTTREDVEAGRAKVPFDLDPTQWVTGLETFAQGTVVLFTKETSIVPQTATENLETIEREIRRAANERLDTVHNVSAETSSRHDDEIEVMVTGETDGGKHTFTVYLGPQAAISTEH